MNIIKFKVIHAKKEFKSAEYLFPTDVIHQSMDYILMPHLKRKNYIVKSNSISFYTKIVKFQQNC